MADWQIKDKTIKLVLDGTEIVPCQEVGSPYPVKGFTTSQFLLLPSSVISYAGISVPANSGWLMCDKGLYLRADYPGLVSAIIASKGSCTISIATPGEITRAAHGFITCDQIHFTTTDALPTGITAYTPYWVIYKDANTFYIATSLANAIAGTKVATSGSQAGVHTLLRSPWGVTDATHFYVPDAYEASLVCVGTRGAGVTAHDTFALGQFKDDQFQSHLHNPTMYGGGTGIVAIPQAVTSGSASAAQSTSAPVTDGANGTPRVGTTTHGKLLGMNFIIKT
jgi:hypothetical protein